MESFRTPNFQLVAHILYWLVFRCVGNGWPLRQQLLDYNGVFGSFDPLATLSDNIETPEDRVIFLTNVVQIISAKARLKLRAKSLYGADGRAVKEMFKMVSMLYNAMQANSEQAGDQTHEEEDDNTDLSSALSQRLSEAREIRELARALTDHGARLYELLDDEARMREERTKALRYLDAASSSMGDRTEHEHMKQSVEASITAARDSIRVRCVD